MNNAVNTISYFLAWGVFYGMLLGVLTGTAFFPILGTFYGALMGIAGGVIGGLLAGIAATVFGAAQLDLDTSLDLHRRRIARKVGLSVVLVPGVLWFAASLLNRGVFAFGLLLAVGLPWAGLASAYVAHHYPDLIANHMLKSKRGQLSDDEDSFIPPSANIWDNILFLGKRGTRSRRLIGMGALVAVQIYNWIVLGEGSRAPLISNIFLVAVLGLLGVLAAEALWIYATIANGLLITFLKQGIFGDKFAQMPPQRSRLTLTGITFVFTLMISWWTFMFAPLVAGLTAYHVYHTLALPDESPEKAKRKEKNMLALDEEGDAEDDSLLLEEEALIEIGER